MESLSAKAILKKYRTQYLIAAGILLGLYLLLAYSVKDTLKIWVVALAVIWLAWKVRNYLYNKHINSVLNVELDPVQYREVLLAGNLISTSALERILAAYYNRDYQTVVDICTLKRKEKSCRRHYLHYLNILARTYFEVGDYEKLREACAEAEAFCSSEKSKKELNKADSTFLFFARYLNGEYEACREGLEKLLKEPKTAENKWNEINARFYYAVACYRCAGLESAKKNFTQIIHAAPKMNYAHISQEYLDAMESGTEYQPEYRQIHPTENFTLMQWEDKKKQLRKVAIVGACLWLVISGIPYGYLKIRENALMAQVSEAIRKEYEDFELIGMLDVEYKEEVVNRICLCDTAEDGLVVGVLRAAQTHDGYVFEVYWRDLSVGYGYQTELTGLPAACYVDVGLFEDETQIPADEEYRTYQIEIDGKTYLFGTTRYKVLPNR